MEVGGRVGILKSAARGIAVSVPITIVSALVGIPLAVYMLAFFISIFGVMGLFLDFASIPIVCNVLIWRAFMLHSSRAAQYSLIVSGLILSLVISLFLSVGFFLWLVGPA